MRAPSLIAFVCLAASVFLAASVSPGLAASLTRQDAVSKVQSEGYSLVSKAEPVDGTWNIWASKDGIAYEVKIDGSDGTLIAAVPVDAND